MGKCKCFIQFSLGNEMFLLMLFFILFSFLLIVPPLIRVRNQYLYAFEGGSVSLECEVRLGFSGDLSINHFVLHFNFLVGNQLVFLAKCTINTENPIKFERKKNTNTHNLNWHKLDRLKS